MKYDHQQLKKYQNENIWQILIIVVGQLMQHNCSRRKLQSKGELYAKILIHKLHYKPCKILKSIYISKQVQNLTHFRIFNVYNLNFIEKGLLRNCYVHWSIRILAFDALFVDYQHHNYVFIGKQIKCWNNDLSSLRLELPKNDIGLYGL